MTERNLSIAYGNSCFAKTWPNKTITFNELCSRLEHTIRTTESMEEYTRMPKAERDQAKDKGGFVAGLLRDNRRKRENVVSRSMLTLDCDNAQVGFIDRFAAECNFGACLYTTHGHRPEAPRVRIIVPLTRDATPDEYGAISRYFAAEWGIDQFDECSYRPHQLMYWPTTPSNGEYIFKRIDGSWLDPDAYLSRHPLWQDCSTLPTSSRESTVRDGAHRKQEDPLAKKGLVGTFCRTYSIEEAISRFLPDVYEASEMEGRYDYTPGTCSAGVVVYDGRFAYSHHATDPACGMLLNAFDLVRIHRFGNDDPKVSYSRMAELASCDEGVKRLLAEERMRGADEDFRGSDGGWQAGLELMPRSGVLANTVNNLELILENDPDCPNFAYNELACRIEIKGPTRWERPEGNRFWRDADTAQLKALIDARYLPFSTRNHDIAFSKVADDRHFHPIRNYLNSLPEWDGNPRAERLLIDYFGASDSPYTRAVSRKFLVAAVTRIYQPGTKFDSVPILNGPQGIGKSTFFAKLAGQWFSDSLTLTDMRDKTAAEKLQGYWILELGELAGMRKADENVVKSFLSKVDDSYRASYGVNAESHPRQCIIVGSTNSESGFLRDITGNRRFWPVHVSGNSAKKAWQMTDDEVRQIWAESLVIYRRGENLYLEGDAALQAIAEQAGAMETDEREGLVREYLDTPIPDNWDQMDLFERRNFLSDSKSSLLASKGKAERKLVCNLEIWCECFGKDPSSLRKSDSYEISAIMQKMEDWVKFPGTRQGTSNFPIYGKQRAYSRK